MDIKDWFGKVAYLKFVTVEGCKDEDVPKSWLSKFDDSYITFEGLEQDMKYLADREIIEQLTHGVGFSPKDNNWYGWSHRAIYGFNIGSTCKKGDCHYIADTPENIDSLPEVNLFEGEYYIKKCGRGEWIAKTMEDAKQMAIDFNKGVS